MKNIFTTCFFSLMIINSFGQVSIGSVLKPDLNVILDLTNFGSKGLLLPKTNTPPTSPPGNIVFDTSYNMISYADKSGVVNYLSPWKADLNKDVTYSDTGKIIINYTGSYPDKVILEVQDGSVKVNNGDVNVQGGKIKEYGHDLVPQGAIIMWGGTTAPDGWAICDGSDATKLDGTGDFTTPDLRGRFIVGYDSGDPDYNNVTVSNVGGFKEVTLTSSEMPSHTHTGTALPDGEHDHDFKDKLRKSEPSSGGGLSDCASENGNTTSDNTTDLDGEHTHTISINDTGGGDAHENRPPYYTLAFIIKL